MSERKNIPKGWQYKKLAEILDCFDSGIWGEEAVDEGISILRSNNIQENRFLFDTDIAKRYVEATKIAQYRLLFGDIVMVKSSGSKQHIGKCAIYDREDDAVFLFSNFTQRLRVKLSQVDPFYLYFYLISDYARQELERMHATSSGLRNIQPAVYAQQEIPLPPLAVQERIVEVLQQADMIRRKRAEARRLADQILPALFLDMFGDPATNPKGWTVEPIGELVAFEISQVKPEADKIYDYIAPEHIESGSNRFSGPHSTPGQELRSAKNRFTEEHVLYCKLRPYLNKVVVPESSGICSSELVPIRPLGKISREFFSLYLRLPYFVESATRKSQGTKMPRFGPAQMSEEHMIVPPLRLQHAFYETSSQLLIAINKGIDSQSTASALFQVLLSRAFTGELTAEWEAANADWIAERQAFYERLPRLALLSLLLEQRQRAGHKAVTLITALMKYAFLAQMEGDLRRRFYRFIPYHYGPCAMELYDDLKALEADDLIVVKDDKDEDKTRIALTDPGRAADLLEEEARKDNARLAALELSGKAEDVKTDPATIRLLQSRAETIEVLRADAAAILDTYGNLDHKRLLETVYEKYPAYAKKSRLKSFLMK